MIYSSFASYYDTLTPDIDYAVWVKYLQSVFALHNKSPKHITELGCGTGSVTLELCKSGYGVTGVDLSGEMLSHARQKLDNAGYTDTLLLRQDMARLDMLNKTDAVICCLDGMNYLIRPGELLSCFRRVKVFLKQGGIFIFDMNSPYKYKNILAGNVFTYDEGGVFCVWQNDFNEKTKICDFYLTFFENTGGGLYRRSEERHRQRSYSQIAIKKLLSQAGLTVAGVYGDFTFDAPKDDCERIFYVAIA